jgi:hypothetical protein
MKGKNRGISIIHLRRLLSYLEIPYDTINDKIAKVGSAGRGLKHVNFPIRLLRENSGTLLGAAMSDGYIDAYETIVCFLAMQIQTMS